MRCDAMGQGNNDWVCLLPCFGSPFADGLPSLRWMKFVTLVFEESRESTVQQYPTGATARKSNFDGYGIKRICLRAGPSFLQDMVARRKQGLSFEASLVQANPDNNNQATKEFRTDRPLVGMISCLCSALFFLFWWVKRLSQSITLFVRCLVYTL